MGTRLGVRRLGAVLLVFVGLHLALSGSALAQDQGASVDTDDQIVLTGELLIESGRTVDTAVIFDGPATIEGTIRQGLFVMNGDADISGTVGGDVVVFNGDVTVRAGAEIGGDLLTRGTPQVEEGATIRGSRGSVVTRFNYDIEGLAGRFAWWVGYTASVLILGLALLAFAPQLDTAVSMTVRERVGSSIGWGIALFLLLPIVAVGLLITIVGIPLGLFVLLALALIYTIGYVVVTIGIGRLLVRSSSRFGAFLVGVAILRLLALIPGFGGALWLIGSAWGLGLLAAAIRTGRTPRTEGVVPPPPMPAAS